MNIKLEIGLLFLAVAITYGIDKLVPDRFKGNFKGFINTTSSLLILAIVGLMIYLQASFPIILRAVMPQSQLGFWRVVFSGNGFWVFYLVLEGFRLFVLDRLKRWGAKIEYGFYSVVFLWLLIIAIRILI